MNKAKQEKWWGVYDTIRKEVVYIYKDEISACNQIRRGASNWTLVDLSIVYDPKKAIAIHCKCDCKKTISYQPL
jgi:hypothetical protein